VCSLPTELAEYLFLMLFEGKFYLTEHLVLLVARPYNFFI
jgi:hypothetical protein